MGMAMWALRAQLGYSMGSAWAWYSGLTVGSEPWPSPCPHVHPYLRTHPHPGPGLGGPCPAVAARGCGEVSVGCWLLHKLIVFRVKRGFVLALEM